MKKSLSFTMIMILCFVLFSGISSSALAKAKTLKAVSFLPKNHQLLAMVHVWVDRINKELKNEVNINWIGGPEVIPGFDQAEAVRNNTVQIVFAPTAYYAPSMPEVNAFPLSKLSMAKEREPGGFFDYMVERHKKTGMMYIGTWLYDPFYLRVSKPIKSLEELKGVKLRSAALYDRMMEQLGAIPVTVKFGDVHTSLERGLVAGFGWPTLGPADWGWLKYTKYIIDIPFYTRQNTLFLMNLGVWNGLGKKVQDKIMDITIKFEPEMVAYFKQKIKEEWQRYEKMGIKKIKFSPKETKIYLDAAYNSMWADLEKKVPDLVSDLKRLTGN